MIRDMFIMPNEFFSIRGKKTMTLEQFEEAKKLVERNPGIVTEFELKVLRTFMLKNVQAVAKELGISEQTIYNVFHRIRTRRQRAQRCVNFWNNMARDKRLYHVLTPRPEPEEESE
jgi:hypothetical protein